MSDEAIHLLAEKIRNSNPATTDPYDLYGWIANAIDLLNELYEDPPMNDTTPFEHTFPARPSAPVPEPLREEAVLCSVCNQPPNGWNHVKLGAHEFTTKARPEPSREETAEAVCATCGQVGDAKVHDKWDDSHPFQARVYGPRDETAPVEASRTPVETAERQCQRCWHFEGEHMSPAIDLGLPVSGDSCQWGNCDCREFVPPSPEAVEPPLADTEEDCGCEAFTTCRWCSHPLKAHGARWCSMCHEELRLRQTRWKANAPLADHPFGCPHRAVGTVTGESTAEPVQLTPERSESGEWRRALIHGSFAQWTAGEYPNESRALVRLAVEQAIARDAEERARAAQIALDLPAALEAEEELAELRDLFDADHKAVVEATALWRAEDPEKRRLTLPDSRRHWRWMLDRLTAAEERATQAEGQRDYLRSVLEQIHRDGHDALSEVSPSTEALTTPSEEK